MHCVHLNKTHVISNSEMPALLKQKYFLFLFTKFSAEPVICFLLFGQADGFIHSPLLTASPAWRGVPSCPAASCSLHLPPMEVPASSAQFNNPISTSAFCKTLDILSTLSPSWFYSLPMLAVPWPSPWHFLHFPQLLIDFFFFLFATGEASQAASEWNRTEGQSEVWNRKLDYSLCIKLEISYLL